MNRKITAEVLDYAAQRMSEGMLLKEIAAELRINRNTLSKPLRARGIDTTAGKHRPPHNRMYLPVEAIVGDYLSGLSELAVARKYGATRNSIRTRLLESGVQPRNGSQANFLRMARLTPGQRQELTCAAHDANKGHPRSQKTSANIAQSRQETIGICIGSREKEFAEYLTSRRIHHVWQQAAIRIILTS